MPTILDKIEAVDRDLVARDDLSAQERDYLRGLVRHLAVETAGLIKPNDMSEIIDLAGLRAKSQGENGRGYPPKMLRQIV